MKHEEHKKFLEEERKYDEYFKKVLLVHIPYFHQRFAKTKDVENLDIAKNLGIYLNQLKQNETNYHSRTV